MRNATKLILIIFLVVVFFAIPFLPEQEKKDAGMSFVCVRGKCFTVAIADTSSEREIGLMNRTELAENSGMLFVFEEGGVYKFWMKNTLIPLDMIWIDGNNKILFIEKNAQPCRSEACETFGPDQGAKYVLEINSGAAEKAGIMMGDEVTLR